MSRTRQILSGHDERELLALVEGELDAAAAEALTARLRQADPDALCVIEQMRADRELLAGAGEPPFEADVLADLEPLIARPMLMPPPGQLRRRYRRQGRRRWLPLAAAAGLGVALVGGIWFIAGQWGLGVDGAPAPSRRAELAPPGAGPELAVNDAPGADRAATGETGTADWPPPGSVIHHHGPTEVARSTPRGDGETPSRPGSGAPQVATFALVVTETEDEPAEALLKRVVGELREAALVRNLTLAEAQTLSENWHLERSRRRGADALADGRGAGSRPDLRAAPHDGTLPQGTNAYTGPKAERLAGPESLAPSFDDQLAVSQRGCAYTVSIRLADLDRLLAALQVAEDRATRLSTLDALAPVTPGAWVADYARVRAEVSRLRTEAGDDAIVHLPVLVD